MNRIPSVFIAILALAVALMAPARAQFGPPTVVVAKTISTELAPRVNVPGTVRLSVLQFTRHLKVADNI